MKNEFSYQNKSIFYFLFFVLLSFICQNLINNGLKFITYDVTKSMEMVSILGSISALFYISIGLISGIIVDFFKKSQFINIEILVNSFSSLLLIILLKLDLINIYFIILFIVATESILVFSSPTKDTIFYELIEEKNTLKWISRRSIVITSTPLFAALILSFSVDNIIYILLIYLTLNILSLFVFNFCGYHDIKKSDHEKSINNIYIKFKEFILFLKSSTIIFHLFLYSFIKTFFIFWPMSSGALFKFGIENTSTQKLYLYTSILLGLVTILSTYFIGVKYKEFTLKFYMLGVFFSGIGIFLLGVSTSHYFSIMSLCILYIGLAVSQLSNSFILKHHLPNGFITHGLSISVIPYYFADIFSGFFFAFLMKYISINKLLLFCGFSLILLSIHFVFKKSKINGFVA